MVVFTQRYAEMHRVPLSVSKRMYHLLFSTMLLKYRVIQNAIYYLILSLWNSGMVAFYTEIRRDAQSSTECK